MPPIALALRRSKVTANGYALVLVYGFSGGTNDTELWRQELTTESWYDFVLHVGFSTKSTGAIEFWVGKDGAGQTMQTLHCPTGDASTCSLATLYSDGEDFLELGSRHLQIAERPSNRRR